MSEAKRGRKAGVSDVARRLSIGLSSSQAKLLDELQNMTNETASGIICRLFERAGDRELLERRREAKGK